MTIDDHQLILNAVNDLFVYTDQRSWQTVERCLDDKVLFDMTSIAGGEPVFLSPKEITAAWEQALRGLKAIHHQTGNFRIAVNGNVADVFCYGTAYHYFPNETGRNTRLFVGSYELKLRKSNAAWKITHFKFNLKFTDGNEELSILAQR